MSEVVELTLMLAAFACAAYLGVFLGKRVVDGVLEVRDITRAWLYHGRHRTPVVPTDSVS